MERRKRKLSILRMIMYKFKNGRNLDLVINYVLVCDSMYQLETLKLLCLATFCSCEENVSHVLIGGVDP